MNNAPMIENPVHVLSTEELAAELEGAYPLDVAGDFGDLDVIDAAGLTCAVVCNLSDIGRMAIRRATPAGAKFALGEHVELIDASAVSRKIGEVGRDEIPEELSTLTRVAQIIFAQIHNQDRFAIMRWGAAGRGRIQPMTIERRGRRVPALLLSVCNHRLLDEGKVAIAYDRDGDLYEILFYARRALEPFHAMGGMFEENLVSAIEDALGQSRERLAGHG